MPADSNEPKQWYVMRDLKRSNALLPAYKQLGENQIEVFTPMRWCLKVSQGIKVRKEVPFMQDLLFVHETRHILDPIVEKIPTLQYRYTRGSSYRDPMTVPDADMERFILAVRSTDTPRYYTPDELTPAMYGRKIRIIGGPLNGYEGNLQTTKGSRVKRLLVNLPALLTVSVEVKPEYIELL